MNDKFWIVAKEVYRKNVISVSFLIMVLFPILIGGLIYIIANVANDSDQTDRIAVVSQVDGIGQALEQVPGDIHFHTATQATAQEEVRDAKTDAILVIKEDNNQLSAEIQSKDNISDTTKFTIQAILNSIQQSATAQRLGLSHEQTTQLLQQVTLNASQIQFDADGNVTTTQDLSGFRHMVALVLVIFIWMFVAMYGSIIAQEIAGEKGTRIMEVILSSVKAEVHFYGKLFGIILVCLTNVAAYAIQGFVAYHIFMNNSAIKEFLNNFPLGQIFAGQFWLVVPIIVMGILLFTFLAALSGSLISRVEDVPKAQGPLMMIGMVGYFLAIIFQTQPDNIVMTISSFIPFLSSFTLPMQIATGVASSVQIYISMGIMLVTMFAVVRFSARLYKSNVLIYSSGNIFATLKQSIRNIQNEKH